MSGGSFNYAFHHVGQFIEEVDGPNRYTMNVTLVSPEDNYLSYCSRFSL